jgi:hypothetical protein
MAVLDFHASLLAALALITLALRLVPGRSGQWPARYGKVRSP